MPSATLALGIFCVCRSFAAHHIYSCLMKKHLFTLLSLLSLATAAQAQRRGHSGSDVSLGLKVGASLTNFDGADATPYTNRFGFHAGVFANIGLTSLFAFQPELLYSQKGAKVNSNSNDKYRLHYIDVPLAFHLNADGLFFELGPQVGFLVGASHEMGSASANIKSAYKSVDFGYLAGLGYQLKEGLGVGLRYNGEFTSFPKSTTAGNVTYQSRVRNSAFQLYLTYSFNGY